MNNNILYIAIACIFIVVLSATIIMIKNIFSKKENNSPKKTSKNVRKRMEELREKVSSNVKDLDSLCELASLEEEYGNLQTALEEYEALIDARYFSDDAAEEIEIYKKLESGYSQLNNKEKVLKYMLIISKLEPNNIYYSIKIASILGKEGNYQRACDYFNKALVSKNEFEIDELKIASLSFFMIKDYKKSILFLEELYKKSFNLFKNDKNKDRSGIDNLETLLLSMYVSADELNNGISFAERILSDDLMSDNHKIYVNKIYMFMLYKLSNTEKFNKLYKELISYYQLDKGNRKYASIIFDFGFYSYFLKDISASIKYFSILKSFNMLEFSVYYLDQILNYLTEVNKAYGQLSKLRSAMGLNDEKYKNERYDKYVDKDAMDTWEKVLGLWEASFLHLDYITSLTEIEKTMDIDKILLDFDANKSSYDTAKVGNINEIDKIYKLSYSNFKKLCQNIVQTKLSYSILQEYSDNIINYEYGDEVNFLAYHINKGKKDLTLISFKRWKNTEIGELILRDFMLMVDESGAKSGILVLPVRLSNSAKSYAAHNDKITVYSRSQFNSFLKIKFV
ncbi:restriction endonuclease [Brachyspira alvinipulli]|uniref:restriction endonuclease n=1 Tax=Brachyspira alvinipulli TaxID=84379 RepID=UPI0030054515